jgi:hypothetical protein
MQYYFANRTKVKATPTLAKKLEKSEPTFTTVWLHTFAAFHHITPCFDSKSWRFCSR